MNDLQKLLKKYGGMPDFKGIELGNLNQVGLRGDAPLHLAATSGDADDVMLLLATGARINAVGHDHNTALHYAALHGHAAALQALLEYGECSYTLISNYDRMEECGEEGYPHQSRGKMLTLDTGANVYWQNDAGDTPLHCAAAHGSDECLEQLLALERYPSNMDALGPSHVRNNAGCTPLLCAAATGTPEGLLTLFMGVGGQRFVDGAGRNMLHLAITRPDYDPTGRRIMQLVINRANSESLYTSEVYWKDNGGNSPLHTAANIGNVDAIQILLKSGAARTLDALNDQGCTPLGLAVRNGRARAVELLRNVGGACRQGWAT